MSTEPARRANEGGSHRLLIATTIPSTVDAFLLPYARHFRRAGWTLDLITGRDQLSPDVQGAFDHVTQTAWSRRIGDVRNFTVALGDVRRQIHGGHYDVVHLHTPIAAMVARAALATLPRKRRPSVVYTAHGFHFGHHNRWYENVPFEAMEWLLGRVTDRLIVINDEDRARAARLRIVAPARLVHLPGIGVDFAHYARTQRVLDEAAKVRPSLGIEESAPLFTMVAALHKGKGHFTALRAFARMQRHDAHLVIAGSGVLRADIERFIRQLSLQHRVHVVGSVADIRPLVVASSATVLPSEREGLSIAVLESLMLGVPVIGSNIRGIADTVGRDGGILLPVGDVDALARALDAAAAQPLLDAAGRAVLRSRLERYALESLLTAHGELYADLLRTKGGRANGRTLRVAMIHRMGNRLFRWNGVRWNGAKDHR